MASMSITPRPRNYVLNPPVPRSESQGPNDPQPKGFSDLLLPPPDSSEWETVSLPPAPRAASKVKR
jgi:hypothetical protein